MPGLDFQQVRERILRIQLPVDKDHEQAFAEVFVGRQQVFDILDGVMNQRIR